jgi:hypothetical protein
MTSCPYLKIGVCDAAALAVPPQPAATPYERELDVSRSADSSKIADFSTGVAPAYLPTSRSVTCLGTANVHSIREGCPRAPSDESTNRSTRASWMSQRGDLAWPQR